MAIDVSISLYHEYVIKGKPHLRVYANRFIDDWIEFVTPGPKARQMSKQQFLECYEHAPDCETCAESEETIHVPGA